MPLLPATPRIEALLFDLGGVVIDISVERALRCWQPKSRLSIDQMRGRLAIDELFKQHERGQLEASRYFDHLRMLFELDASDQDIAAGWNAILVGEIAESVDKVRCARRHLPCFAFTNTSPTHQAAWTAAFPNVVSAFDRIFASSELGLRKPDRAAYEAVIGEIGVQAEAILFFDDTLENVEGARAAGLRAVHVRRPADIEQGMAINGIYCRD
jgi:putative hydrolase of the HAD superfamily